MWNYMHRPSVRRVHDSAVISVIRRGLGAGALALVASVACLVSLGGSPALADSCPNAQFRTGPSASLPDCRAYELVTPADKGGAQDMFAGGSVIDPAIPATDGNRIALGSFAAMGPNPGSTAFPGGGEGHFYVFSRTGSGWDMASVYPPGSGQTGYVPNIFTADLSQLGVWSGTFTDFNAHTGGQTTRIGPAGGPYTTIATTQFVPTSNQYPVPDQLVGASSDFSHVLLQSLDSSLLPAAGGTVAGANDLYEWANGQLRLVNVTTGGSLVSPCGALLGDGVDPTDAHAKNAVSSDGSKIFFTAPDKNAVFNNGASDPSCFNTNRLNVNAPHLYMRLNGTTTVDVSAPDPGVNDPRGFQPVFYQGASADGSKVFFTTATELTPDDTTHGQELYEYDTVTGTLTRISKGDSGTADGNVNDAPQGSNIAISDDGSVVYFEALGQLTPDAPNPSTFTGASWNLYRYDTVTGTTRYIATVGTASNVAGYAATTPDGEFYTLISKFIAGVDSSPHADQLYRYDSADGSVICVSCATGAAGMSLPFLNSGELGTPNKTPPLRAMSDDGSYLFFDTTAQLVPQDTNTKQDVYEWHNGTISLISSGSDSIDSRFLGANADASNVFIGTHSQLVPWDTDTMGDVYDARIGGGFPPPPQLAPCSGDGCQGGLSAPPSPPTAASLTFAGPGNALLGAVTTTAPVKVLSRVVRGSRFSLTVSVPGAGRITIAGAGIRTVRRSVSGAGTYRLKVSLTAQARKALKRKLKLRLGVGYAPASGQSSRATVALTVKA